MQSILTLQIKIHKPLFLYYVHYLDNASKNYCNVTHCILTYVFTNYVLSSYVISYKNYCQ